MDWDHFGVRMKSVSFSLEISAEVPYYSILYSCLRLSTGLDAAAFTTDELPVAKKSAAVSTAVTAKTQGLAAIL